MNKIIKIGASLMLGVSLGAMTPSIVNEFSGNGETIVKASKRSKALKKMTKAINSDLDTEEVGDTKWKWNDDDESWEATLDPNSQLYQAMNDGEVSIWNSYVRDIKAESKVLKKNGLEDYDYFQILNPNDESKVFLQIEDGKVEYNVGEDLD